MLQAIRDRATGWIAWTIIILICIPFALWGVQEYVSPQGSSAVAEVNDAEIGYYDFQTAYRQQRMQIERMMGRRISGVEMEERLRAEALESLIREEVLVQTATAGGLRVGDGQLAEAIRTLPAFTGEGGFNPESYEAYLRSQGLSSQGFEFEMRRSLLTEQFLSAVQRSELVTRAEVNRLLQHQNAPRRYRRLIVDPASVEVPEPDEAAIEAHYRENEAQYQRPTHVKLAYIEIARDAIAAEVSVEDEELRAIYENSQQNYRTAEQRQARHILIQLPRDAEEDAAEEARLRMVALRDRISGGEDFAEVAKEVSDDPGSASSGGDLGLFGRGIMDPAFEEAAFSLEVGALSEPVRSSFGWHLIEVTDVQGERVRTFEEAREDLVEEYRNAQAEQIYAGRVDELANLAFENPQSLDVAADALEVSIQTSGFFSRDGDGAAGLTLFPAVREAAFSLEVLDEGTNSELIELGPGRVAVVRVEEREEARPLTLEEARDAIRNSLLAEARGERAREMGAAVLSGITNGADLDSAAEAQGLSFEDESRGSPANPGTLDLAARRALFALPAPTSDDVPRVSGLDMPGGGYQLLALLSIEKPESEPDSLQIEQAQNRMRTVVGAQTFDAVMSSMRDRSEVTIFQDNLTADAR